MFQNTTKTFRQELIGFAQLFKISPEFEASASQVLCASDYNCSNCTAGEEARQVPGTTEKNLCCQEMRDIHKASAEDVLIEIMHGGVARHVEPVRIVRVISLMI